MSKSTLTRRNLVAGAAAVPALALPAVAGAAATPSLDELAALDRAAIVARAEQMVEVLRTCHVADGWQLDEPRAARFLDSLRRLDFADGDSAEQAVVLDWVRDHGQSYDWIFDGDPLAMVCRGAARSARAPKAAGDGEAVMTDENKVVSFTPSGATDEKTQHKRKGRRTGGPSHELDWQGALQALEPMICDLERAAEIADLVLDEHKHLGTFAVAQTLRLSQELREKYYELYPYKMAVSPE